MIVVVLLLALFARRAKGSNEQVCHSMLYKMQHTNDHIELLMNAEILCEH